VWSGSSAWFDSNGGCVTGLMRLVALLAISLCTHIGTFRKCQRLVKRFRKAVVRMAKIIRKSKWAVDMVSSGLIWIRQGEG
jgi:hypothetical protein